MYKQLSNGNATAAVDLDRGGVVSLVFQNDPDRMDWLIGPELLEKYGYQEDYGKQLGNSRIFWDGRLFETEHMEPAHSEAGDGSAVIEYDCGGLLVSHFFALERDRLHWTVQVTNHSGREACLEGLDHWMPIRYVMHEDREQNLHGSCSFVPSISGDYSHILCRKRSGEGPDLLILNRGRKLRSTGSLCRYKNLFFEKSAPSLSGLVLFTAVNAAQPPQDPVVDWQYRELYQPICLKDGQSFSDQYEFLPVPAFQEDAALEQEGYPVISYPPVALCGEGIPVFLKGRREPESFRIEVAGEEKITTVFEGKPRREQEGWLLELPVSGRPGERRLCIRFTDETQAWIIFPVYASLREMVQAICGAIYQDGFISDPEDPEYCGYRSTSPQGESCAKGSVLLLMNQMGTPDVEQIRQVEQNAVYYLKPKWLDEEFRALKKYPGGFARIIDMDYLTLEFYLLGCCKDEQLALNSADEYLHWAWRTSMYRMTITPDKSAREAVEVEMPSMISWLQMEMIETLEKRGFQKEAEELKAAWENHIRLQCARAQDKSYVETEHYFDNAGMSVYAETLFRNGNIKEALPAAELLLANVAASTDYRCYAPDRWWEAFAPMYHNLWAVFSAKALLTAFEKTGELRFLEPSYRAMMPMFYNYDWTAVSSVNRLKKGSGASAYCLTNPNMNEPKASRNRFGQSIFKDDFFGQLEISGDDWDLGADLLIYLYTFGRTAYVYQEDGRWKGINCRIEECAGGEIQIKSYAAFPMEYHILPYRMTVCTTRPGELIKRITLRDGECTEIEWEPGTSLGAKANIVRD